MAYSFRKIFFIGQNLKHVQMTSSFLKLLAFFRLALYIYCLEFITHLTENIVCEYKLYGKPIMK